MKKLLLYLGILLCLNGLALGETDETDDAESAELSDEYRMDLIARMEHLDHHGPVPASLDTITRPICGLQTAVEYELNRDRLGKVYALQDDRFPLLDQSIVSPDGFFRIHYTTDVSSGDAPYGTDPLIDTLDGGDGVPDYINKIAQLADSAWDYQINTLGFPAPPNDDFYAQGGDSLYDVYIEDVGSAYYGATYPGVQIPGEPQQYTSYLILDSEYDFYPYNDADGTSEEFNRRLDAARVTMAHEFQHAIHFGMDATEWEGTSTNARLYWWEMSAVWMEEAMYDDINDYYGYIPSYLSSPWRGLRYFVGLHPYGAAIFPIFLSEWLDDMTITRKIWERCRDLGVGPNFGQALDQTVQAETGGTDNIDDAFREFTIWNIFTGSRASQAPAGYGYSEGANYYEMTDSTLIELDEYPIVYLSDSVELYIAEKRPEVLAASYINMLNPSLISDTFNLRFFSAENVDWNVSLVGFPIDGVSDATVIDTVFGGPPAEYYLFDNFRSMSNIVSIYAPVSTLFSESNYTTKYNYSFVVYDSLDPGDTVYAVAPPYPNPINTSAGDQLVTFHFRTSAFEIDQGEIDISIYNIAGEKVRDINLADWSSNNFNITWDLKNNSGKDIAAGVYLAFVRYKFDDGREDITQKYKLAVF